MKKVALLFVLMLVFVAQNALAQYVTVPDVNFRNALKQQYPSCFNAANMLDTVCAASTTTNDTTLLLSNKQIANFTGIHYFKKMKRLYLSNNNATSLPKLPNSLKYLNVAFNNLSNTTVIPNGLKTLDCRGNAFTVLPVLPSTLDSLACGSPVLTSIPNLPSSLKRFSCTGQQLNSIGVLPNGLSNFSIYETGIANLPPFPSSLLHFSCTNNAQLTEIPALPNKLRGLDCSFNPLITSLSVQSDSLVFVNCESNNGLLSLSIQSSRSAGTDVYCLTNNALTQFSAQTQGTGLGDYSMISECPALTTITHLPATKELTLFLCPLVTSLPSLPIGIKKLYLSDMTGLVSLPALPNGLDELKIFACNLTSLPALPPSLKVLDCVQTFITQLPALPPQLRDLVCNSNQLEQLPALPANLDRLVCSNNNNIDSLPALNPLLSYLDCNFTSIRHLPPSFSNSNLVDVYLSNSLIGSLPALPNTLRHLEVRESYISCLPYLPVQLDYLDVSGTGVSCLPNLPPNLSYIAYSDMLPICNPTNSNSELCPVFPRIAGYVYNDANNNGVKDAGETPREGEKVSIPAKGYYSYTNENGFYEITVDSLKAYTASIAQVPTYYTSANPSQSVTFTAYGETVMRNFPLVPQGLIKDFKVSVNNVTAFARPGFPLHFRVKYENIGTIAGNAQVKFAHSALYSVDSTSIAHTFSGDTLVWNFSNVPAGFTGYIDMYGKLSASAVLGSTQNFYASVNQNDIADNVIADNRSNLALVVGGSYDPNDKQGTKMLTPTQVSNGEFINYTIRFQNTGTDTAFTVVVADTLANNLQANTLEMVANSHNVRTSLKGNIIYFEFLNILLPDSNVNEPRSHGFVSFRIKPKNTLVLGNTIQNKAAIYFDYNAPVITNTVTTTVAIPTGITEKVNRRLEVYPNPLEGEILTIPNMLGASAKLLSLEGKELRTWSNIGEQISLQNVAAGMYLLEVSQNGQRRTAKVVVK